MELRDKVRAFVQSNFYVDAVDDDRSLLDSGVIDSTGVLELIAFVEAEFGLEIADEEILPENFDSIAGVARYVARKSAEAAPRRSAG